MSTQILGGEEIVQARIRGDSVRAIAKHFRCTLADVKAVLDDFADTMIDDSTRKHTLALELARLDELQTVFHARALEGDVPSGALVAKIIERRCTMLGLYTPPTTTLQVIEAQAPKQTSTQKIRAVLDGLQGISVRERELEDKADYGDTPLTSEERAELDRLRAERGQPPLPAPSDPGNPDKLN